MADGREIRFFEVRDLATDERRSIDMDKLVDAARKITKANREALRYHIPPRGPELYGRGYSTGAPPLLVVHRIRRGGFPQVESAGELSDLDLPEGAGLAESTHVAIFDGFVAAVLRGVEGPTHGQAARYISHRLLDDQPIKFEPLLRPDTLSELNFVEHVTMLHMRVDPQAATTIANRGGRVGTAVRGIREAVGDLDIELTLRLDRDHTSRATHSDESARLLDETRRIVQDPKVRDRFRKLELKFISSETERTAEIDFLKEKLAVYYEVEYGATSRVVRDSSAASVMMAAYEDLRPDIERALELAYEREDR